MKALALNGGGMGGYRTARFLQHLEEETKIQSWRLFDLVAGVSAGSIVGAMIAKKMPAKRICELFKEFAPKVFGKSHCFLARLLYSPQFPRDGLEEIIREHADFKMSECAVKFMDFALNLDGPEITSRHWKSWIDTDVTVADTVISSSVAPSYFAPYTFEDIVDGEKVTRTYTDGGVITNNPTMSVIAEAVALGESLDSVYVLNVANGRTPPIDPKKFISLFGVMQRFPGVSIGSSERCDEYEAHQLIGFRSHVVMPDVFIGVTSTDFEGMDAAAKQMWDTHGRSIIDRLAEI
jgi:patatin-like phospholipase/acyl hydrolase